MTHVGGRFLLASVALALGLGALLALSAVPQRHNVFDPSPALAATITVTTVARLPSIAQQDPCPDVGEDVHVTVAVSP